MKKTILSSTCMAMAMAAVVMTGCSQAAPQQGDAPAANADATSAGLKIAYVEVDSLMSQYEFCKEYTQILQKRGDNAQSTISKKEKQLQDGANSFQQKLQNNGFTSREQAEGVQATLQRQAQDLQELQARLANELNEETNKYNNALRDSLQNFLREYNKTKKFDLILTKAGDNILWAEKSLDITTDVVNGLNKRYKSTIKK